MPALDLQRPRRLHIVGAGGLAMSAISSILVSLGHQVSGSDQEPSAATDLLAGQGVRVAIGHGAANVGRVDAVIASTAIAPGNPELVEANRRGIPVLRRADAMAAICASRQTVAVSGTHGKTTTSSMLALILIEAGLRPSFVIGGTVHELGGGWQWDDGDLFVVEADESDGTFLELGAEAVLVTSVEADHLDFWGTVEAIEHAFLRFVEEAPGPKVVCADDAGAARLARVPGTVTYGVAEHADYRITGLVTTGSSVAFAVEHEGARVAEISLPAPGTHNARNACGAVVMALLLGAPADAAERAMARYAGVERRYQRRGESDGVTFVDDYAHNPGKVHAALEAAAAGGWRRVVCVFQPHLYSRTFDLAAEFGQALGAADVVVVTDVYGSREAPVPGVSGKLIVEAILAAHPGQRVVWLPERSSLAAMVWKVLRPGDLCLTLGAGDVTQLPDEMLARRG